MNPASAAHQSLNRPRAIPSVVRSREHLRSLAERLEPSSFLEPATLPVTPEGVTYTMAQTAAWLDDEHFAVGRWDGTMSLFSWSSSPTVGPVLSIAVNSPSAEGVQMITPLGNSGSIVTSNDDGSLALFRGVGGSWAGLSLAALLRYPDSLGVANSGQYLSIGGTPYLVVGHANGYLTLWSGGSGAWTLQTTSALQNPHPVNPWGLHNIRGVSTVFSDSTSAYVAAGSEDGFISIVRVPDGEVMSQTVFNPAAQRGINTVSSTEEGALWQGSVSPQKRLTPAGYLNIGGSLGSALTLNAKRLAAVNYNLYEYALNA
jgi:hypothetical protein